MYYISSQNFSQKFWHIKRVEKSCKMYTVCRNPTNILQLFTLKTLLLQKSCPSSTQPLFHFGRKGTMMCPLALKFPYLSVEFIEFCVTTVDVPLILFHFDVHLIDMMGVSTTPPPYHWWDCYLNYRLLTPGGIWYIIYVNIELCIYEYEHVISPNYRIIEYGLNEKQRIAKGPQLRC